MVFRIRHLGLLTGGIFVATVAAWFLGFVPLIYMMPLFALQALHLALACPRCNESPYVRNWGPFRAGVPWLAKACPHCSLSFTRPFNDEPGL